MQNNHDPCRLQIRIQRERLNDSLTLTQYKQNNFSVENMILHTEVTQVLTVRKIQ